MYQGEENIHGKNQKVRIWKLASKNNDNVYLGDPKSIIGTKDSEILLESINTNGTKGAIVIREASRLLYGDPTLPEKLTNEAQKVFINSLVWIHGFDGLRQNEYNELTPRDSIQSISSVCRSCKTFFKP